MKLHNLRVEGDGLPLSTRIFIEDFDITDMVTNLTIHLGVNQAPRALVEIYATPIIDEKLQTLVEMKIDGLDEYVLAMKRINKSNES